MSIEEIEREIHDAYVRLGESAASVRFRSEHYLDSLAVRGAASDLFRAVTVLTAASPWALGGFDDPAWAGYEPDLAAPPPAGVRVGVLNVAGAGLPPMPAVARLTGYGHLLIAAERRAAAGARSLLQALTLRLAAATRPGTVRFALADPVGQGQHLSAFLRLPAPLRVGSGVAASVTEIETLLTTLTAHVIEVTQTRLTNVHDSVEAYNATSTGLPVPYHILVMADFPAGVSERSAELLTRLARNGLRAGVYIIATVDPAQDVPRGFDLAALTERATNLSLADRGALTWDDPQLGQWVIEPDQMPPAVRVNPWLDAVGTVASTASRDLPFSRIVVAPGERWAGQTTDGLQVQIGVEAKGEPQYFVMGAGGVHHGLVGGDVRMGKTNLLHVLITQLALRYPPEELELYLLDFKEVEFDAYLTQRLPHARAITSRTDREFGLSMLRRFHDEIERRARLCREAKVTQLPDYRQETGRVLSRALVIMDEFQVLFSEEDRLSREAGALLADIAKRGAAFGLHLLLATQSPGGGSLVAHLRPSYEQMALRIALGCTLPSVSQAILGEGNDAATKLTRAGQAIYNDRRGEGANPVMSIAKLGNRERLDWIAAVRALAGDRVSAPPASFDPDAAADFADHPACAAFAANPGQWRPAGPRLGAWLGEAIEIKPATTATFEPVDQSNLLIVGGEEGGHGLVLATVLSAAVQQSPADVSFVIAEFARPSSPFHDFFAVLKDLPHEVRIASRRAADAALRAMVAELDARLADSAEAPQSRRFFLVVGMHRWQELVTEGEWGKPSETAAVFTRLAQQGPELGIHVVAWADSYATCERALRRPGISQFAFRVALRLPSTSESDSLIGVPAAASLADDRALFRDADWPHEQVEKFKPYSIASLRAFARSALAGDAVAGDAVAGDAVAGDAVAGDAAAGDAVAGDAVRGPA